MYQTKDDKYLTLKFKKKNNLSGIRYPVLPYIV